MKPAYLFFPIALVSFILAIKYDYSFLEWGILFVTTILSIDFFRRLKTIKDHVCVLFVIFYIFCSVHIMALFELTSGGFVKTTIYDYEYRALALWGNHLFFVLFSSIILARICKGLFFYKRHSAQFLPRDLSISIDVDKLFTLLSLFTYVLSVISFVFDISNLMSEPKIVLPFHLNGLIDELRGNIYPFVFSVYLYDVLIKGRKMPRNNIILFLVYAVMEVFIRQSKGAIVSVFFPCIVLIVLMGRLNKKVFVRYLMPLFIVFIISYPIIEVLRVEGEWSFSAMQKAAKSSRASAPDEKSSPYIRTFLSGMYYVKLIDYVNPDNLSFDFRRVPALVLMGGGINYMTYEVDGFSENDGITVGVTGLNDALLWGGYMLCWITLVFFVLFAYYADHGSYFTSRIIYKIILFFLLYTFLSNRSITMLMDHVVLATVMNLVIKLFIARYYYKRIY